MLLKWKSDAVTLYYRLSCLMENKEGISPGSCPPPLSLVPSLSAIQVSCLHIKLQLLFSFCFFFDRDALLPNIHNLQSFHEYHFNEAFWVIL